MYSASGSRLFDETALYLYAVCKNKNYMKSNESDVSIIDTFLSLQNECNQMVNNKLIVSFSQYNRNDK